jgi:ADP-dependent NAD(P)H-hydrate dehydratase / NAD(P)H-hydrate epimerase
MTHLESLAYRDGASESDFMEEAGSGVALVAHEYAERQQLDRHVVLLCGKGNNAGDAYVAGIHLLHLDYDVLAIQLALIGESSPLCKENHRRFLEEGGRIQEISTPDDIYFPDRGLIIDGIFGTGFHGSVGEPYATAIRLANASGLPIIAVDIPSGLNGETGELDGGEAIIASETAFLGLPKTGFFLQEGWNHVGKLRYVDFGLSQEYIEESEADLIMLTEDIVRPLLPRIIRNRHKYQRGYVMGLAGSPGMPGAALLSSIAALRGGAGMVRLLHPDGMQAELANAPFELIKIPYRIENLEAVVEQLNKPTALFIGPGIGRTPDMKAFLSQLFPRLQKPCVIDADALTLLSEQDMSLPKQSLLTPHLGEMLRLLQLPAPQPLNFSFLRICQNYAETRGITLILKGGPSFIFQPDAPIRVNPVGDPGMATAGSGDVLTGLLAALLSQGLSPHQAASLGVYIHGLAGEHAAIELSSYCVIATDILFYFPEGFRLIEW